VHPWEMMGEKEMQKYWLPWLVGMPAETSRAICSLIFSGVLEKCKNLRICFAHGGGSFPYTLGRIEHGFQVRPDLCAIDNPHNPRNYLGKFWLDSLVHDAAMLDYLVKLIGAEKVALGTDYPFPLGEEIAGSLKEKLAREPSEIGGKKIDNINRMDGVKFVFADKSWMLMRPSGTEPLVRIYAEAENKEVLEVLIEQGRRYLLG